MVSSNGKYIRVIQQGRTVEMLEPYALKGVCAVFKGLGAGNSPRLIDDTMRLTYNPGKIRS